jgi:hypothetical protein
MSFNTELINRLKTGSIKNVMLFGDSFDKLKPPYVVIKPIASGDRKLYQIIAHMALGMQDLLEKYIIRELPKLLNEPIEADGNTATARSTGFWLGPYVDEGDNTLAISRDFYVPIII